MQLSKEPTKIQKMFAEVAPTYDRTNTILSLGIHLQWKKLLVDEVAKIKPRSILDCATGTGDVAVQLKKRLPDAEVTGIDFCEGMIALAPQKAKIANVRVNFDHQDITALTFPDGSFDAVTISFGIRNVQNVAAGIAEMKRVLKPGGKIFILEFSQPENRTFARFYHFYSSKCLPAVGGFFSGQKSAYDYLQRSSAEFPAGEHFVQKYLRTPGLQDASYRPLSFGIAALYTAVKGE